MLFFFAVSEGGVVVERWRNQKKVGFVVNRGVATSEGDRVPWFMVQRPVGMMWVEIPTQPEQ